MIPPRATIRPRALALAVLVPLAACAVSIGNNGSSGWDHDRGATRSAILEVLDRQAAAWNRGDLDGFMSDYWKSPDLVFTSGGRIQRGWQTTLERYRATYGGSTATMGRLSFSDVSVYPLDDDAAWVLGRWRLERAGDPAGGVFTLVFRRIDGEWKIVHDHTSAGGE